ncbi:MAG TPA: DUF1922 domain-containing protein [Acidilobales archaeon]|nr:DUF1922 domain-containing protein [Acidilobales archaeon]
MVSYKIIRCPFCRGILAVKAGQKTKTCTYCGKKIKVSSLKALALAKDSKEAGLIVRFLKAKEAGLAHELYRSGD